MNMLQRLFWKREEKQAYAKIKSSGLFDEDYYRLNYSDVKRAGVDPLLHFIRNGAAEGRSPSSAFNLAEYVRANAKVDFKKINPVVDWIVNGEKERRIPPISVQGAGFGLSSAPSSGQVPCPEASKALPDASDLKPRLEASGVFDPAYYCSAYEDVGSAGINPLDHYLQFGFFENRNPSAAFDTHYYLNACGIRDFSFDKDRENKIAALVSFLDNPGRCASLSRPPFSVTFDSHVTGAINGSKAAAGPLIAVHIHLFYPEMSELFACYLTSIGTDYDLFISTTTNADRNFVENVFRRLLGKDKKITVAKVENRGRDIAPFICSFPEIWRDYEFILHLHSKKSPHAGFGSHWLSWVLRNLLGNGLIVEQSIGFLQDNPSCAMLFPDNYYQIKKFASWGGNEAQIASLLDRFGFPNIDFPVYAHFSAGSMGWFRASAFRDILASVRPEEFEHEEGQVEGTLAHVCERAIPLAAVSRSYTLSTFYLNWTPAEKRAFSLHAAQSQKEADGTRWRRDTPEISRQAPRPLSPLSRVFNRSCLDIHWIVPDFRIGAGGHMTIFRTVEFLEKFGHRQTLWIQNALNHETPAAAKRFIQQHYRKVGDRVFVRFLPDDVRQLSGDVLIATDCWTVFPAVVAVNFKERFYFIQDYEPYFHPMGAIYLLAESTYNMGLAALCAGEWLQRKAEAHRMWARKWDLASDSEFYFPPARVKEASNHAQARRRIYRIAFYCRSYTPRRAVSLGLAAFEELARRRNDFQVLLFGEEPSGTQRNFPCVELGILAPSALGETYRRCDAGVVFSTTNYSLAPLEMMACDLPVVEIDSESTRTAYPEGAALLASSTPNAVADAIEQILDTPEVRAGLVENAKRFVSGLSWEKSAKAIESALVERLVELEFKPIDVDAATAPIVKRRRTVSVVIPTFNGGVVFHEVLRRAASQKCDFDYDVLVIDSSSADDTAQFAGDFGGRVRLHSIPQSEFQHGRTRNLGFDLTEGDFVAYLTQDATPLNDEWLAKLIGGFEGAPCVAGVIGRHKAYPNHSPLVARDLEHMFDRMADLGPVFSFERGLPSFYPPGGVDWRMTMHFYSDNNSAMRRTVWSALPYPEIDWGEDQVWAWEALRLGFTKYYVNDAVVLHSHDYPVAKQMEVGFLEGVMFAQFFGYNLHPDLNESVFEEIARRERLYATTSGVSRRDAAAYVRSVRAAMEGRYRGYELA